MSQEMVEVCQDHSCFGNSHILLIERDAVGFGNTVRKHNCGSFSSQVSRKCSLKAEETRGCPAMHRGLCCAWSGLDPSSWTPASIYLLTDGGLFLRGEHVAKGEDSFLLFSWATLVRKPYFDGRWVIRAWRPKTLGGVLSPGNFQWGQHICCLLIDKPTETQKCKVRVCICEMWVSRCLSAFPLPASQVPSVSSPL